MVFTSHSLDSSPWPSANHLNLPPQLPSAIASPAGKDQLMQSIEQQKVSERQNTDDRDKISQLPDCILQHILSFLPTEEAVASSVLSKRWKFLWKSVHSVDFDDSFLYPSRSNVWPSPKDFLKFVSRVLVLRGESSMEKFRLSCRVFFSGNNVSDWVSNAVNHNVQELDLCLFVEDNFSLPHCVFNNTSLQIMKLEMTCTLNLSSPIISLPCLKKLHLCLVTFPDTNSMQKLLSSCPFLEELAVLDCDWTNLRRITISIPSLKSLTIDDLPFCSVDDLHGCEIEIVAGNLLFFDYSGYLSNKINLYDLSSSASAVIHIPFIHQRQLEIASRARKLFRGLKNVSSLRISSRTIKCLVCADDVLDHLRVPTFPNLTALELSRRFENNFVGLLLNFLQVLPKLESLRILEGGETCEGGDIMPKSVPSCLLCTLKTVSLQDFKGCNAEMGFLKVLLKGAQVLEKIDVVSSTSLSTENQKKIEDQLRELPVGSRNCTLSFV